jgi:hypothetical protein
MAKTSMKSPKKSIPVSISSQAQQHVGLMVAELVRIMRTSKNDLQRVSASQILLDRGYGKASLALDIAIQKPLPKVTDDMTPEEREAVYRELVKMPARSR